MAQEQGIFGINNFHSYHIERGNELVADSNAEWGDIMDHRSAGGLVGTEVASDRHALIFADDKSANEALEELRDETLA